MRWSTVRVIWCRELRDQLRDRRTVFMIAVLPILLYPLAGFGVMQLALGVLHQQYHVGVQGAEHLPAASVRCTACSPVPALAWLTATAPAAGAPGLERLAAAAALAHARTIDPHQDYPPLIEERDGLLRFHPLYLDPASEAGSIRLQRVEEPPPQPGEAANADLPPHVNRHALDERRIDLLLVVPPGFHADLLRGGRPRLFLLTRERDDRARMVSGRLAMVLSRWKEHVKEVRLLRQGLPADFDDPFRVRTPGESESPARQAAEDLFDLLVRVFPFVLVLWSLAGALYPAVDLCAGEKERGTMETLLVSPASREEIVWGKFLTIWVFSGLTALLNLLSMALTAWHLGSQIPHDAFRPSALFWAVLLLLPLSAFFSALCLAIGAYARSSKEGQYYLMPLFLVTMPLIFLTLAPGVELNPFYSMVPVTGVALLLQKLMAAGTPDRALSLYFVPVLAPLALYGWLALRWAIEQFNREEVLFREAERLDLGLWLKRLFRDKEALPTAGQALFGFALILGLRWLSFGVGTHLPLLTRTGIGHLAFVAAPPLFMALLLTTRPVGALALHCPPRWAWPAAVLLAVLVWPPLAEFMLAIIRQFPALQAAVEHGHPLAQELRGLGERGPLPLSERAHYFLVLALLPAVCEELAFRGFILTGLLNRFRPGTAVLLSSFLFALYQMNVFQFAPHFIFGAVLGLFVVRTGSVLPAVVFHLVYNALAIGPLLLPAPVADLVLGAGLGVPWPVRLLLAGTCGALAASLLGALALPRREPVQVPPP